MEQEYKSEAAIYAVLEQEIIDLTLRPGSALGENPLCTRFGVPRSLIRVVLQRLQENGLVRIVPYKGTTVTRLNRRIVDELIYERAAVEARVLRDFSPHCTPAQRTLIRARADAYDALARAAQPDYRRLYEADRLLHETWFAAQDKLYLWSTLQNAHADYSRFRMLDIIQSGGLAEVNTDHKSLIEAIERCDLAAFEPLIERHLYGGPPPPFFPKGSEGIFFYFGSEHPGHKDLQPDGDEDHAAQHRRLARQLGAEFFADANACIAQHKGHRCDQCSAHQRHCQAVLRNGKAHRQRVDAGSHALHHDGAQGQSRRCGAGLLPAAQPLPQHLTANVPQQHQCDPGDDPRKRLERLQHGVDADPPRQRHSGLKPGKDPGNARHPFPAHLRLTQAVGHRHRECVHRQAHPQQQTIRKKYQIPLHCSTLP